MAKATTDLWYLASVSENEEDSEDCLHVVAVSHSETNFLLTHKASNFSSTCFNGKTGGKSRMDNDKKDRLTERCALL